MLRAHSVTSVVGSMKTMTQTTQVHSIMTLPFCSPGVSTVAQITAKECDTHKVEETTTSIDVGVSVMWATSLLNGRTFIL